MIEPYTGNPAPIMCENHKQYLVLRHISFVKGIEPQLFLTEQCVKYGGVPAVYAQGLYNDRVWLDYLDEMEEQRTKT